MVEERNLTAKRVLAVLVHDQWSQGLKLIEVSPSRSNKIITVTGP